MLMTLLYSAAIHCLHRLFFQKSDVSAFPAIAEVISDEYDFPDNRSLI